ncbi:hypothetical protein A3C57_00825 [Candidatus Nomurabacteria bacterium RIFCSPHIGHO2_02_FULL_33_12]|uniref:Bacterial spore germination immunoglobulin-like domain-containing protein n=1 Tax=Candidatus Nomurabacteria bacterium RIFCSPLOWO2_01_FULL_33_17 TaxID=1801764 RepID=A0A1F6WQM9_9BACT|nr:MAG: hypothetical protein A3C57_00825 [Candidatus Nomurabacteria bacterium RIFCSPHIGHO2_02_FULL_33_12]OGI84181.1 MAG: hypothetical protein A2903_01450 [Candidatus Nomurabacteria bacterium RIFCSPLOWO2_01_FULL_33_17]
MSDSHGSNTPTILIVIIGIILVGALIGIFYPKTSSKIKKVIPAIENLGKINGSPVNPNDNRGTDAYYTPADIDSPVCGIKIFSPLPGQKVSFPLEVSGYVNGCNWVPFESHVGTLEIRDMNQALSKLIIIPVDGDTYTLPAYFKIKITPTLAPTSQNGVLIFHNEDPSGLKPESFQVPIIF